MRRSLPMFAACLPFYAAATYGIVRTAMEFPNAGIRPFDWAILFALGIVVPVLQSVYLVRALEPVPATDRLRWLAVWPSAMASVVVLMAATLIYRALAA